MDTKTAENAIELACKNWSIVLKKAIGGHYGTYERERCLRIFTYWLREINDLCFVAIDYDLIRGQCT